MEGKSIIGKMGHHTVGSLARECRRQKKEENGNGTPTNQQSPPPPPPSKDARLRQCAGTVTCARPRHAGLHALTGNVTTKEWVIRHRLTQPSTPHHAATPRPAAGSTSGQGCPTASCSRNTSRSGMRNQPPRLVGRRNQPPPGKTQPSTPPPAKAEKGYTQTHPQTAEPGSGGKPTLRAPAASARIS